MKKDWKKKWKHLGKKAATYCAVYGVLPLFCSLAVALLVLIKDLGFDRAQALFTRYGEQSVAAVVGGAPLQNDWDTGYYYLSGDFLPPLFPEGRYTVGLSQFFAPVPQKTDAPPPEILYDALPAGAVPVIPVDLSSRSLFLNGTKYTVDVDRVRNSPFPVPTAPSGSDPLVLVVHTHGTECYFEDRTNLSDFATGEIESYFIHGETLFRSSDTKKNVVQVGSVFAKTLNQNGIPTLHCTIMHDQYSYNDAYKACAETVEKYLKEYPSIQYVIDLHRDSVVRGSSWVKTQCTIKGQKSAQVMLVVGTNQNGSHPNWEKNLIVATAYKDQMDRDYPSLARSTYLRTAGFNQQFTAGCMLLEVGSAANSLSEAETAARFAAEAFTEMLRVKEREKTAH